jgi:hypothetical protein
MSVADWGAPLENSSVAPEYDCEKAVFSASLSFVIPQGEIHRKRGFLAALPGTI